MSHHQFAPASHFMRIGRHNVNCVAIRRAVGAAYDAAVKKGRKMSQFFLSVEDADLQLFLDAPDLLEEIPTISLPEGCFARPAPVYPTVQGTVTATCTVPEAPLSDAEFAEAFADYLDF